MYVLRDYQQSAVESVYEFIRKKDGNPCIVIPTGGGKTPVIATICHDVVKLWGGRILVLAHVKELLEQTVDKIKKISPMLRVGVYSAGLKRRDTTHAVIVAGIQSVYDKADQLGKFDLVLIDEAHLIPTGGEGMYRSFLNDLMLINPELRIVGLTATPYRTGSGLICGPNSVLNEICHETGVKELIVRGYLSKLVSRAAVHEVDTSTIKIVRGEFDEKSSEEAFCGEQVILEAATEICDRLTGRKSALIFCSTVKHAEMVGAAIEHIDPEGFQASVTGATPASERADILDAFKRGIIKYLLNVNVLTTGFDAPNVDAVCLLRATTSPGLYYQMVGRGFRILEGKEDCLILDFGGNVVRHGPVDMIRSKTSVPESENKAKGRICPNEDCRAVCSVKASVCPVCGFSFAKLEEAKEVTHQGRSDEVAVVSEGKAPIEDGEWFPVNSTSYSIHTKKGAEDGDPRTLRVTYRIGFAKQFSEWVCVEHEGFAKNKANAWWQKRCTLPCPDLAETAVDLANDHCLAEPVSIKVFLKPGSKFPEIVGYDLPPPPEVAPREVKEREPGIDDFDQEAMTFMDMLNARGMNAIEEEPPF